jgi:hypothetical protein
VRWGLVVLAGIAVAFAAFGGLTAEHRTGPVTSGSARAEVLSPAARLAVSRGLGAGAAGYGLARFNGGFLAHNQRQGLTASFGAHGATVSTSGGERASIALQWIGLGSALHRVARAQPLARGNRVEYRRSGATEWFANGPAGVEQGFTIARQPAGTTNGELTLALGVSGTLTVRPGAAGGLVLVGAGGRAMLRYGDLSVTDATGRTLPAHMTVRRGQVSISVAARRARYPVTVDPLISVAELYAASGKEDEELGYAVAVSGKTVVAGAPSATVGGHASAGAAYVFTEGTNGWSTSPQATELLPSTSEANAEFGYSVAISGKTIAVGSPDATGRGPDNGAAFVFSEPAGGWGSTPEQHQAGKLVDTEDQAFPEFGKSVAVSGETVVVGSPRYVNYLYPQTTIVREHPETGAAFVFVQPAGGWSKAGPEQIQSFTLMETEKEYVEYEEDDFFGASVAIQESGGEQTVVAMAPDAKVDGHFEQGAAFVFIRPPGGWTGSLLEASPGAKLTISNGTNYDRIGEAEVFSEGRTLAISGNEIVIGAPEVNDGSNEGEGAAYVFSRPLGGWGAQSEQTQVATLLPSDGEKDWHFGKTVAAEEPTVMVGGDGNGYVYSMPQGGWSGELHESSELVGSVTSVSLTDGYALVGDAALSAPEGKGHTDQGGVLAVPLGPVVATGGSSVVSASSAVAEGSVAPNRNAVGKCSFQYGTSTSYGGEAQCAQTVVGTGSSPTTVTAELTGLTAETTYHYRAIASNGNGTSYGADETFTTTAPTGPGSGPVSTTPTTTATTSTTTSTTPAALATTVAPQVSPVLGCTTAQVALIDVVQKGAHVLITGAARLALAGKRVSIELLGMGKTVASAAIAADGTFSVSAPLPPAKIRDTNLARYQASVGSLHSLALKLERRMYMVGATRSGAHVLLSGYVTGSFKVGTVVKILLRVTCSKEEVLAKTKLSRSGRFNVSVAAPTGAASQIAVYRAATTVLDGGHPETTFTLPTPPTG